MHNPFVETDEMREINDRVRKQSRTRQIGKSYGSINANQGMTSAFKPIKRLYQRAPYHTNLVPRPSGFAGQRQEREWERQ